MGEIAIGILLWNDLLRVTKRTGGSIFFKGTFVVLMSTFDFMKQFSEFATLAAASGASASFR